MNDQDQDEEVERESKEVIQEAFQSYYDTVINRFQSIKNDLSKLVELHDLVKSFTERQYNLRCALAKIVELTNLAQPSLAILRPPIKH